MKLDRLILKKIIKTVATRYQILRLKCTKFDFGWGAYSAPTDPLAGFEGPISKGREGKGRVEERKGGWEGEREGKGQKGRGGRAKDPLVLAYIPLT